MKTRIIGILASALVALSSWGQSPHFSLIRDSLCGKYTHVEIIEFPGKSADDIRKKVRTLVTSPGIITLDSEEELALRYTTMLGTFKYVKLTERFQFKEGKARWIIQDVEYLLNATELSHFDPLEKLDERQLKKILPQINELFGKGREDMMKRLMTQSDDWW